MPYKDKKFQRTYDRRWKRETYHKRRQALIERMGGKCAQCGTAENLEFNHIYQRTWFCEQYGAAPTMIKRYTEDFERGHLNLLCSECNKRYEPLPLPKEYLFDDVPF
jgi:5-methylcytosine-specific restriction endonuclease McrA